MCTKMGHISIWEVLAKANRSKWVQASSLVILWIIRTIYQVRMAWITQIKILSSYVCVCRPNLGFSNLDHFRMLGWYQNDPLIILGLVPVLVCARVQVLVGKIWIQSLYYMCVWHFCKFEQIKCCPKIMKPIPVCRAEFFEFIGFWIISNGFLNRSLGRSKDLSI